MVCGIIPFETDAQIEVADLHFRLGLSNEVVDCIKRCLAVSQNDRITLAQLQKHPWLKNNKNEEFKVKAECKIHRPRRKRSISSPAHNFTSIYNKSLSWTPRNYCGIMS